MMRVGRRFRVSQEPSRHGGDRRIELVIGFGAFGSGEHETTSSCLEILEGLDGISAANVLDLGSGTGILAIAALRLGAGRALCVDIDPRAAAVALANCRANRVDDRVKQVIGTMDCIGSTSFDLVFANIYPDILSAIVEPIRDRVAPGARVILSGIPWQDLFELERDYRDAGFELLRTKSLEEYCTLLFCAPERHSSHSVDSGV
jgi:ribosomal protein L11 methyltransferase